MARKRRRKRSSAKEEPAVEVVVIEETDDACDDAADEEASNESVESLEETTEIPVAEETEEDKEPAIDLNKELADMMEKYMRTRAEMENFRKRKVKEIDDARRHAKIAAIEEIMPVMDQFQMAVAAMDGTSDLDMIKMGMKMIQTTFDSAFENLGVDKVLSVGLAFDPKLHEAVSVETSEDTPIDHVVREWKSGYKIGDFLIRPASVVVSSGVEADEEPDAETDDPDADETAE